MLLYADHGVMVSNTHLCGGRYMASSTLGGVSRMSLEKLSKCRGAYLNIYVIPHTLPCENTTRNIAPLNMSLIVEHNTKTILKRWVEINPWSGDNIELNLKGK